MTFINQLSQRQTAKRAKHLFVLLCVLFATVMGWFVYLIADQGEKLKQQGEYRTSRVQHLQPKRGLILDVRGETLAVSELAYDIWVDLL